MGLDLTGVGSIADLAKSVINLFDPNQRAQAQAALLAAQQAGTLKELDDQFQLALEQIKANAAEAAQPGLHFRDGAGWVCVAGFALALFKPLIEWGSVLASHPVTLPPIDQTQAWTMLSALLGLGGMHVYQQVKTS